MDAQILSRIQFAFTVGFHIIFPTLNLGLAVFLMIMEGKWLATKSEVYLRISQFWTKIFALTFGMGVMSGIVLSYEFGTNFGPFMKQFGSILGPLFSYETFTLIFLQAGFLGVMLFGWKRVTPGLHYLATVFVGVATTISAMWIISANSWMQFPSGYSVVEGQYLVSSWWDVVFNPLFMVRFIHMLLAAYVTTAFVIAGISSWYLLHNHFVEFAKPCLSIAMLAAIVLLPIQMLVGDLVRLKIHEYQPIKTAAMEGLWKTTSGAPLVLFGFPHQERQETSLQISIPKLASLLNTNSWNGELKGLDTVSIQDQPPVGPVFFMFRIMIFSGIWMFALAIWGLVLRFKNMLYHRRSFYKACIYSMPIGFISTLAGWMSSEMGRQPWVVHNLMRTSDSVSLITSAQVMISLLLLIAVYGVVFSFYIFYLKKLIHRGPRELSSDEVEEHLFQYMTS